MYKVKIFGAGSIGNHLAFACRSKGWAVTVCDTDPSALERMKTSIYPSRYGAWDPAIALCLAKDAGDVSRDIVIIGTPPQSHFPIALAEMQNNPPKVILIEKPACPPSLALAQEVYALAEKTGTKIFVGYNHTVTDNTVRFEEFLRTGSYGKPQSLHVRWLEHWGGIFGAHPWLAGPHDSYLGFYERGGGACSEHSHAVNIWQHVAHCAGMGRVVAVTAHMEIVKENGAEYDRTTQAILETEKGLCGTVIQDVVTEPAEKAVRLQCSGGALEWAANIKPGYDAAVSVKDGKRDEILFPKKRPDDFKNEIELLGRLAGGAVEEASAFSRGLDTMLVIAAIVRSSKTGRKVKIDYAKGYTLSALVDA